MGRDRGCRPNRKESGQSQTRGDFTPISELLGIKREKVTVSCQECGEEFEAYNLGRRTRRYCNTCTLRLRAEEEERLHQAEAAQQEARYRELIAKARIPKMWRDVTFENSTLLRDAHPAVFELGKGYAQNFNTESGSLVFYSKGYGCGKTRLMCCMGNYVLHQLRRPVLFQKARDLLLELRHTFSERGGETEVTVLDQVLSVDFLMLDDVGVDNPSAWLESTYWTIFDRRLEWQLPIVVTTNYPLEAHSGEICLGERIGYGAVSRLSQMCQGEFIDMSGSDLR